ncbi:MAG: methyltransferase domain-containing protein [Anaerolineae bacterium]
MAQELFLDDLMPDILAQWRYYLSLLDVAPGDAVLDVGCNTGETERLLLGEFPNIGQVTGLDYALARCRTAVERLVEDGAPDSVAFVQGDGARLPFGDALFDRALCVETLEWLPEPVAALRELRRVLQPGGVALVIHTDFCTQAFAAQDRARSRRIIDAFSDSGPNGQIGRELYGLCRAAGFAEVEPLIYPLVNTTWGPDLYGYRVAHMMVEWLKEGCALPPDVLDDWLADLAAQSERNRYFYSVNRYICRCLA